MLLIGLLLLGATGAFVGLAIAYNLSGGPQYTVSMFELDLATMNALAIFCSGLALALLFCLSLVVTLDGAARRRHRHRRPQAYGTQDTSALHDSGTGGDHGR